MNLVATRRLFLPPEPVGDREQPARLPCSGGGQSVGQAMARVRRRSLAGDRERPADRLGTASSGVAGERMPAARSSHSCMSASSSSMSASGPRAKTSVSQALQGPDAGVGIGTGTGAVLGAAGAGHGHGAGADAGAGIVGAGTGAALGVAGTNMGVAKL